MKRREPVFLRATLVATLLACGDAVAQTTVRTILDNGKSENRYDIVILGDGYRAAEQSKFDSDAKAVIGKLFQTEPYKTFEPFFNAHTVFRASKDSGADQPDVSPPIVKDTVYDASYNTGGTARCLYIKNTTLALQDAALAPAVEGRVMVIVNDGRYGGCAGTFAVTYNGSSMTQVQVHEFGHSFARVADEYDYPNGTYTGAEPSAKNVTADPTGMRKWPKWLGYDGVSAFEGAQYYLKGLWRPKIDCIMRTLGQPVCPVCAEQITIYAYKTVSAIDDPQPANATVIVNSGVKQSFSFTNLAPATGTPAITWRLDGVVQTSTTAALVVDTTPLAYGNHTVLAQVQDNTAYVREDPSKDLVSQHSWTLQVGAPPLPDLKALFLVAHDLGPAAGATFDISSYVQNAGTVTSPAVTVEHFLSADQVLTTSDAYLGSYTQNALPATQSEHKLRTAVRVPAHLAPGPYHLALVIDRTDAVKELSEGNNVYWVPITVVAAGCKALLSYDDSLLYPPDAATIQASNGGVLHPVVTAACDAGATYLILLGCSGIAPGTSLAPNLTLPLNLDACTDVFYQGLGSPLLAGFLGKIDASGYGRAKLTVPPNLKGSVQAHFAAVLIDAKGRFVNASSPAVFVFR